MSLTLAAARAILRRQITSTTAWPNATLDGWLADAIRAYSLEFPRRLRHTITLVAGQSTYDLPGGAAFQNVLRVEHPAGNSPPEFLIQQDAADVEFQAGGYAYALRAPADDRDADDEAAGEIILAPTAVTGETVLIEYAAAHRVPAPGDDTALITVPDGHLEALVAFVEFRQAAQLNNDARWHDCIANDKLSELSNDARQAWQRYKDVLESIRGGLAQFGMSRVVWRNLGL